jgi:hypothetical protein
LAKVTLTDFAGGITDSPFSSPDSCAEIMENVFIRPDRDMETCPGIEVYDVDACRVSNGERISKLAWLDNILLAFSAKKVYKVDGSVLSEVTAIGSNPVFNLGGDTSIVSLAKFNNHFIATNDARSYPVKIWKDGSSNINIVTAGLPQVASDPIITPTAGANAWVYAFVHFYSYDVDNVTFEDYGPIRTKAVASATTNVSITNIPVLSNGSDYNYDTAAIKIKIYRTTNGGTTFYYVGQVTNGTTSYSDTTSDANLILNETLYTSGGILENDPPPPAKYVWEANNTYYYGDILDGANEKPDREIQSVTSDPDSVPGSFFTPYNAPMKGGGSVGRANIVFTTTGTFRKDGVLAEDGTGATYLEPLSKTIGCVAHNSIVNGAEDRLYWAAEDGLYMTNGYSTPVKLARKQDPFKSKIDTLYKNLLDKENIHGCYDPNRKLVFWTIEQDGPECDSILVYHEAFDAFTTISTVDAGILPTALVMDGEDLIIGDGNGYIFRLSDEFYTFPTIEVGVDPEDWGTSTIIHRWKSIQAAFGDGSVNKYITKLNAQGNPETNIHLVALSYTNGEPEYKELAPFELTPSWTWGDVNFTWGDAAFTWDRTATLNQTRRFPAGRLRARHRAIELTNAYSLIQSSTSQNASRVTVNGTANTAVLVTPAEYAFGTDYDGYDVIIDEVTYEIASSTADTLTILDPDNTLPTGTYHYEIWGYPKGERMHILGLNIEYEMMTDTGTYSRGATA